MWACQTAVDLVIVIHQEPANTTPSQHLSSYAAHASYPNDGYGLIPDLLVVLDDAHALQGHEATVRVAVYHFCTHLLHLSPGSLHSTESHLIVVCYV